VPELQTGRHSPAVIAQAVGEVDRVIEALAAPEFGHVFDLDRMAIGGMSLGGMVALRRLCDPHEFRGAAVEATTGWLTRLYFRDAGVPAGAAAPGDRADVSHDREKVRAVDPMEHLAGWRPIPLLALHSEADQLIPVAGMRAFIERLRAEYKGRGAEPAMVEMKTWPQTGAPDEHIGFGRVSNDAKNLQTEFLRRALGIS
jgi:dienelactone hydrolase